MNPLQNLLMCLIFLVGTADAKSVQAEDIPDLLKSWIPWVLSDQTQQGCPFLYQDFQQKICNGSGVLKLDIEPTQGRFSVESTVYESGWLILPGDNQNWPQQVLVNQNKALLIDREGYPAVWLPSGSYQLSGNFYWDSLPKSLAVPANVGIVQLTLDHKIIRDPHIDQGSIWFNSNQDLEIYTAEDTLDLQVFRQVIDDNPLQIQTRLEISVTGKSREISLAHALLPSFIPVGLDSPLPASFESDGRLIIQARPGRWIINIHARHPNPLGQLDFSINDLTWPTAEVWVFKSMPALRLVEIEHLSPIDASQTNLPPEWAHLPAYRIEQGQSMGFKLIRSGDPDPEPSQLKLQRKLWLDFDGNGYSVSDRIIGKMTSDWRLNALSETELGQVLVNGQNQLITRLNDHQQGVEVRRGELQLQADSRIKSNIKRINAVGWDQSFQEVQTELNIPPGWWLLAVNGADNEPDSWLMRWTLLDLFLVLITSLAVTRLWAWQWGLIAFLSLSLIWHEADAPRWIWINTLAAQALFQVWPQNRFINWIKSYRYLCWMSLLLIVIPFMVLQMRIGIYPQLERPWQPIQPPSYSSDAAEGAMTDDVAMRMATSPAPRVEPEMALRKSYSRITEYKDSAVNFNRIDPDANLQTGPGLPQWQWRTVQLSWNGAVDSQQQIRLWYLSPGWSLILHIAQVLLVAMLSLKILGLLRNPWRVPLNFMNVWLLLPCLLAPSQDGMADIPDQAMLEQLKARLLEAPQCLPSCAVIASMKLSGHPNELNIELEIHAQQALVVPLPAQINQWWPERVDVNEKPSQSLVRQNDGTLWLALEQGVHKVQLYGRHKDYFTFSLPLLLKPQFSKLSIDGWQVEGLYEDGKTAEQLQFTRVNGDQKDSISKNRGGLPAFVRIERTLHIGLDWHVTTRVFRLEGNDSPVVLKIPLLSGEAVTTEQIRVENGHILLSMAAGVSEQEWQSTLEKNEHLELKASETSQWSEIWRADVSPIWHMQLSGIAVVHHQDQQGAWMPEWRPWPGEIVNLQISRPPAVLGPTLTIDKSELRVQPGKRSQIVDLSFNVRSSKGGQHTLILPTQAELQNVSIDGVTQPIRQKDQTVMLPIRPGAQQIALSWQTPDELQLSMETPLVNLGIDSVNSHIQLIFGQDRWLLFTSGPNFGPAVLFWGMLIVLLIVSLGLGQISLTPLKNWQWFLLLIGLSQIHLAASLLVVFWLFALGIRAKQSPEQIRGFNLFQIGLGMLTLLSIGMIFVAVQQGLLGSPDMQIIGNQSTTWDLKWYQDHSGPTLPTATVVSVPMMVYRLVMLIWSLWMSIALLGWLRWGWDCFSKGGLWKKKQISPTSA